MIVERLRSQLIKSRRRCFEVKEENILIDFFKFEIFSIALKSILQLYEHTH